MATEFQTIKHIDQNTQDTVSGFLRKIIHSSSNNNDTIPPIIIATCILYYYLHEHFTSHGDHIKLSDDNSTATVLKPYTTHSYDIAFGNIKIDMNNKCIYQWKIKCVNIVGKWLYIGICGLRDEPLYYPAMKLENDYWFGPDQSKVSNDLEESCPYGSYYKTGDIVKVEFDTMTRNLRFYVNDEDQGIAYDGHDINFGDKDVRFAVLMDSDKEHSVKIIGFEMIHKKRETKNLIP